MIDSLLARGLQESSACALPRACWEIAASPPKEPASQEREGAAMLTVLLSPLTLIRLEGLAAAVVAAVVYARIGGSWLIFVLLFLVPDLSMLGYLRGPRVGAAIYNLAHTYLAPILLGASGVFTQQTLVLSLALILFAHIGIDRLLGFGLKYPSGFKDTHLQRL
jgi:Domain of unknown function (DUF4260)